MSLNPEFVALLRNNDIPSESTIQEVTESLKSPLNELQEIDSAIQRLCELLEGMKIKRQSIQKRIDDYNFILSPVRRLPLDVLHEIFFHCLPNHRNPIMKSSESPVLLTRICSSWRAIALSSPRIWSKIHIPLPGDPSFSSGYGIITDETSLSGRRQRFNSLLQMRCDVVRGWLSRSGTCPLSISIHHPSSYSDYSDSQSPKVDELSHEMFDMLLTFADRWSDIDISMPEEIYIKLQGSMKPIIFPSLKSLRLNSYRQFPTSDIQYPPIQLLAAPGLCSITLNTIQMTYYITANLVQPIWNQLTHITLASSIGDIHLLTLLRQCPNLVFGNFMVTSSHWPTEPTVDREDILLPCLESLGVNDGGVHAIMTIMFNAIKAPALTKLSYQGINASPYDNSTIPLPAPVIPLLSNSTLISDLLLDGILSSQDTQECLRHGERVIHFVLGRPPRTDPSGHIFYPPFFDQDMVRPDCFDLKLLSIGSSTVTPFPRLESLEAYNLARLTDEDLLDLITSRTNAFKRGEIAALKSVKIHFRRRREKDITEEVSRLAKEAGVEVKLDLTYAPEGSRIFDHLSPSFGLTPNDCLWSSEII
jgi:hypothetical protein